MTPITIAYFTARKEPHFEWFCRSLIREAGEDLSGIDLIFVDFYAEPQRTGEGWSAEDAGYRTGQIITCLDGAKMKNFAHVPPMGNPWQGPHRLTKDNWFAKASYLNTAVCYTATDYLVCIDDLSVLCPGWLAAVRRAVKDRVICCGHYQKVQNLKIEDGRIVSFDDYTAGHDRRGTAEIADCYPGWTYGCSLALPIDAMLAVNGWPETSNGMGYEDCVTGKTIAKHGYKFRFDPKMKTLESEEHHHLGAQMRREDPGISPDDKSHAFLRLHESATRFENYFGPEGLRGLRDRVLGGSPMPIMRIPEHDWFTKKPLIEL